MSDLLKLIRPDLQGFVGYSSAATELQGAPPSIRLDANESPWPPFGGMADLCAPNRYVESQPLSLRQRLADIWGVKTDEIFTSCGSDQAIDLMIRLFCRSGIDQFLTCPPTFAMYAFYAKIHGVNVISVPLREDGQLDLPGIEKAATENTKLIFIPTPAAPMGHAMRKEDILELCRSRDGKSIVIADEAYVEFSSDPEGFLPYLNKVPNLMILRTLSKAHALAGERVGCALGPRELIRALVPLSPAYPLAASAVRAALDTLSPVGLAQSQRLRAMIKKERARLLAELPRGEGVLKVWPSEGNFIFIETTDTAVFMARLRRYDILARSMDGVRKGAVRLTIGSPEQNDLVLQALGIAIAKASVSERCAGVRRRTSETQIDVSVDLDHVSAPDIETGIGFFDHMLAQIASHGDFALTVRALGDLEVDAHHTIEDCALALGEAIRKALGDKKGIGRYGFTVPLDDSLARLSLDLSGRPYLEVNAVWIRPQGDGMSPDLAEHFFRSFAQALGATLHIEVKGENNHHMIEACFKALGRALRQAVAKEGTTLPSTKGVL